MNRAEEDYLKLIYELQVEANRPIIKNNEIKDAFGYTDQSVNDMIKRLSDQKFVKFVPYKGVALTKKGIDVAVKLVRAHRIWEVFLTKHLNYPWHKVHDEAERLEHASSEHMVEELYKYLEYPKTCSHGNPIPKTNGEITIIKDQPLLDSNPNDSFIIERVTDDPYLLTMLDEFKIGLKDQVKVIAKDQHNEFLKILTNHGEVVLTFASSKRIFGRNIK
ncbi:MAG TPA: metal-dependent transcriptional regulator [Acholeplasma sp.]|nr:metal-dependent transcriptional regulator [Acholeplasma sp.]